MDKYVDFVAVAEYTGGPVNPRVEAFFQSAVEWWSDLNDHVRGLIVGLVCGFILGAFLF